MPIYTDPSNSVKYAYSSTGLLDEIETAKVISSKDVSGCLIILSQFTINDMKYIVTSISDNSFRNCNNITSVVVPDSVANIGNYAFSSCAKLKSITIPDSVVSIGSNAFNCCSYLENVAIGGQVEIIEANTFVCCTNLKTVSIPDSVVSIGKNAFAYCSNLSSINIPPNVTSIGDCAFGYCGRLLAVNIPEQVAYIGINAFNSCVRLASVRFESEKIYIQDRAFEEIASPAIAYVMPGTQIENIKKYFTDTIVLYMPIISYITPNNGCVSVQTKVTIVGKSLTNIVNVMFGHKRSIRVSVVSDSEIDVIVPGRIDAGTVDVILIDVYKKEFVIPEGYTYTCVNKPNNPMEWGKEKINFYTNQIRDRVLSFAPLSSYTLNPPAKLPIFNII